MSRRFQRRHLAVALAALFFVSASGTAGEHSFLPGMLPVANPTGVAATFNTAGKIDLTGPFFQSLGTNGRACVSCHQPQLRLDDHAGRRAGSIRGHARDRSDLSDQ